MMRAFWLSLLVSLAACGGDETESTPADSSARSTGAERAAPPPPRRMDAGRAVEIAMAVAEERGYDTSLYADIVVAEEETDFIVQMRQPMIREFLRVSVRKSDGSSVLETRTQ